MARLKCKAAYLQTVLIPAAILFCFMLLAMEPELSLAIPELTGLSGVIIILLAIGQLACTENVKTFSNKNCPGRLSSILSGSGQPWSPGFILTFALLLRLIFLWHPPTLSDDLYRYCLDGIMLISGHNPYSHSPVELREIITPEISLLLPLVNHPNLPTIYPPAAQIVFASGAVIGKLTGALIGMNLALTGMKFTLIVMDTLSCALIIGILKKMNLPLCRATIYAWHPLPVLEISSSGHIDGAAIFFLLMAIYVSLNPEIRRGYWWSILTLSSIISGIFMGLSILTKWMPLIFLPGLLFLMKCARRKIVTSVSCAVVMGLLITLFCPDLVNSLTTLNKYLQHWEFSGFAFRVVRDGIEGHVEQSGAAARIIIAVLFLYLAYTILLRLIKERTLQATMRSFFMVTLAWLILTPTLYPWYTLYLMAFLPFYLNTAGIVLSWSVLLSYQVLIPYKLTGEWIEDGITPLMIVAAPAAAFAGQSILNHIYKK